MRVAIAEDGALFREGLALLLQAAGHEVAGSYLDGDALVAAIADDPVDVAVLDIRMPPGPEGGLVTAERVRALRPEIGLLLLSHYAETHYLMRVLEIGSERIGYRLKERVAGVQVLGDTLNRIADGEIVIEPVLAKRLVQGGARHADTPIAALSERELDVLRLMAEGRANNAIAGELFISTKAVEKNIAAIFTKLGLPGDATVHHRRVLAVLAYLQTGRIGGPVS
ncbi:DNA-binding NarL/FixJ family response regulator [Saccharothrix ecbatanensis]|jgi:DNA-binding NarL/FixJ family response regulator|uniref:DNA-binding NarL/FixJ family response regulator n=1 Tax=Saccharothrix ecbatanensis TaxID=1105145 RepID=A0A7W9HJ93_9PSEU|nr:response regulator transcription factor [Saccharothrix ecbatanensis]MBB5803101.1 DNA-binding NarL/FixJ family response regulator [Saccharothrix ecbatanensis]